MDNVYNRQSPPARAGSCANDDVDMIQLDSADEQHPKAQACMQLLCNNCGTAYSLVGTATHAGDGALRAGASHQPFEQRRPPPFGRSSAQVPSSSMNFMERVQLPILAPIAQSDQMESFRRQVVFSCVVMWLFNFSFGAVAYALANHAELIKYTEPADARIYGRISLAVSVAGIVVAFLVIVIVIVYSVAHDLIH